MEYLGLAARIVVGLVFVVAGVAKLRNPQAFRASVADYQVLPASLVTPVARVLPPLEVVIAAMLLLGVLIVPVSVLAALVLVVFAGGIWLNVERGRRIGCGCGFRRRVEVSRRLVLRNGLLAATAAGAAIWPSAALALYPGPGVPDSTISTTDAWAVVLAVVAGSALVQLGLEGRRFLGGQRGTQSAVLT